jgi:hypothetical protein
MNRLAHTEAPLRAPSWDLENGPHYGPHCCMCFVCIHWYICSNPHGGNRIKCLRAEFWILGVLSVCDLFDLFDFWILWIFDVWICFYICVFYLYLFSNIYIYIIHIYTISNIYIYIYIYIYIIYIYIYIYIHI